MLTLAIGDLYIPERTIDIPSKFKKLLSPNPNSIPSNNKISEVVCLGNITNSYSTLKFLHDLSSKFSTVKGEFDNIDILTQQLTALNNKETNIPAYHIITCDDLRIGFTNGYQIVPKNDPLSLLTLARELNVDILVWGGTHKVEAYTLDGKFFVNPGSATGAYSFDWPDNEDDEELVEDNDEIDEKADSEKDAENVENADEDSNELKTEKSQEEDKKNEDKGTSELIKDVEQSDKKNDRESLKEASSEENKENLEFSEEDINEVTENLSSIPSFCLLETHGKTCVLYIYIYINGEVKVDKVTYQKE